MLVEQLFVSASTSYLGAKQMAVLNLAFVLAFFSSDNLIRKHLLFCFDHKKLYVSEIVLLSLYCRPS